MTRQHDALAYRWWTAVGGARRGVMQIAVGLVCFLALFAPAADNARAASCQFLLGFAALHDQLPGVVGACAGDEQHNGDNGDALQPTVNGLLVWRKADNWTAFTNGYQTWINGPLGIQQRLNAQRFWWESNPGHLPLVPPPVTGDRCHTAGVRLSVDGVDAGAGNLVGTFRFTNTLDVACTVSGYPGAELRDDAGNPLPTSVVRGGGPAATRPGPTQVRVAPGASAIFRVHWEQVPVGDEPRCPTSAAVAVTPPDEYAPLILPMAIHACGGGRLDVSAVQPSNPATDFPGGTLVKLAFIGLDRGDVGCGDQVVLVDRAVARTAAPLRAALDALLAEHQRQVTSDHLYNALAESSLHVDSVSIQSGTATIGLAGRLSLGGVCDDPRVEAQIRSTALQFPSVSDVRITLNGAPLTEALSER
jgi:hypothetical protein